MADLMKINEVAEKYEISKRTLRYYEELGILKSVRRGASQSRYFTCDMINRLEQILLLRNVQFSLNEIISILSADDKNTAFLIFTNRLNQLEKKISKLNHYREVVDSFIHIGRKEGLENINIYQLLKEQIYVQSNNERMIKMENNYGGEIIKVEFGTGIVPLADPGQNGKLIERIKEMRKSVEAKNKRDLPLIRIKDNENLDEFQYEISLKGRVLFSDNMETVPQADRLIKIVHQLETMVELHIDEMADMSNG